MGIMALMNTYGQVAARVLTHLVTESACCRRDLAQVLQVSKASVSRTVAPLLDSGLVCEGEPVEREEGGPGRRTVPLSVRSDCAYLVGTDLEGRALRACVLNASREVVAGEMLEVSSGWSTEQLLHEWRLLVERVVEQAKIPSGRLAGVGGGLPGVVACRGFATRAVLPPGHWTNLDASEVLGTLGVPATAANNVLCVSEYEQRVGVAQGESAFLSILVRYGLGAALYADGQQLSGANHFAGEFGHMRLSDDGPLCSCGKRGCLDVRASGRTMPDLSDLGYAERQNVLQERAQALGCGIANLLKIFQPPMVLLNGLYNPFAEEFRPLMAAAIDGEYGSLPLARPRLVFGDWVEYKTSIGAALRAGVQFLPEFFANQMDER